MERAVAAAEFSDYLFDACGYFKRQGVVSGADVAALREELTPHWAATSSAGIQRVRSVIAVGERFAALANQLPQDLQISRYINQPYRLIESYALRRTSGSSQPLHNGFSERQVSPGTAASRTMWRHHTYHDGKTYCMMVKILVYLTTVGSREDGPFCLIEGSHKANYSLPLTGRELDAAIANDELPNLRAVPAAAGDVVVLNEALMHGTLPKTSGEPRIVLAFSYAPRFVSDYDEVPASTAAAIAKPGFYA
jgi:ectoine hydroxylase-related dioxygenase (phytanoyl-CoA dioxygenase family)